MSDLEDKSSIKITKFYWFSDSPSMSTDKKVADLFLLECLMEAAPWKQIFLISLRSQDAKKQHHRLNKQKALQNKQIAVRTNLWQDERTSLATPSG